jgi:hypothetical protein
MASLDIRAGAKLKALMKERRRRLNDVGLKNANKPTRLACIKFYVLRTQEAIEM